MRIGSLFSGYGGLDLAVQSVLGGDIAWHVEYDKAPSRILDHHFPGVTNYGDVTKLDFTSIEPVDVLTGGYPCQPFSHAGLRKGTDDDRHLWPHVLRAIREMGPRLAILENVRGHLSLGFDSVLADLADVGWSARWGVVRASDAGAPHQRARLFIVAYPDGGRREQHHQGERLLQLPDEDGHDAADAAGAGTRRGPRDVLATPAACPEEPWSDGRPDGDAAWGGGSPVTHASGERHGRGQDAGMVGRLGATPEVIGRQTSPARAQSRHRGATTTADAQLHGLNGNTLRRGAGESQEERRLRQSQGRDSENASDADNSALVGRVQPRVGSWDDAAGRSQGHSGVDWSDYAPAIHRWEAITGRRAPAPTESGRTGAPRLAPAFVEWMMGLPDGWVTDPAIGISRNDQLKALGNGVVPQQAALALDVLLKGTPYDLRQTFATV